ncbi:MAG: bifunctional glycosyltransferase/class I SAM-dependent methyltransferase [Longimicrobiales bacterium]
MNNDRPKVLIFIVAYNAQTTLRDVLRRIPSDLAHDADVEVLVIDDASTDRTFEVGVEADLSELGFKLTTLVNPVNQGYGGNQKIGYHYAIENGFDAVALLHGDGQYAPEILGTLLRPVLKGEADAVFGSRMMERGGALRGGMPLYKYVGNRILTFLQNRLLNTAFSEFHSGYRIYRVDALRTLPFSLNSNDFHFDTEIIIQLVLWGMRIREVAIPTYYGDEICRVNGLAYAWNVTRVTCLARAQRWGILSRRQFEVKRAGESPYLPKLDFDSSHRRAFEHVQPGSRVLDLGCGPGHVGRALKETKSCTVVGMDLPNESAGRVLDGFVQADLNQGIRGTDVGGYDAVLVLDVLEHLSDPEDFLDSVYESAGRSPETAIVATTGNIGFFVVRMTLFMGAFNYGSRGILDRTHTRLFTFGSFRRLFEEHGFDVSRVEGIPAPFPLAFGRNAVSNALLGLNRVLIRLAPGLFSYQILVRARARPSLAYLLTRAHDASEARRASLEVE